MPIYPNLEKIPGQPARFKKTYGAIISEVPIGGALKVLTPLEFYTSRQRAWYRGVCLPGLSDWNGDSVIKWDDRLKKECHGKDLLNIEYWPLQDGTMLARLTIKKVGKRKMTQFIQEILDLAVEKKWPIVPPDPDLRKKSKPRDESDDS
jgi:hypothetical protein